MSDDTTSPNENMPEPRRLFVNVRIRQSIQETLDDWCYDVRFDGSWVRVGFPSRCETVAEIDTFLKTEPLSERVVLDKLLLHVKEDVGIKLSASLLKSGLRRETRRRQSLHKQSVLKRLLQPSRVSANMVEAEWSKLGDVFDMPKPLAIAIIQHTIHQVKRKALNLPVMNHLMPVIFSKVQGTGKTSFVRKLAAPLEELASGDILLSQFADPRSGDIYRFSLLIVDDMEQIPVADVPALKSLITAVRINRRILQTSSSASMQQAATLIGTANRPVTELIDDETGHRRFPMMPFRNGNKDRGGDPAIWDLINELDFQLIWESVDPFNPSPIIPLLSDLHRYQDQYRPVSTLLRWLRGLDLGSEKIKAISVGNGIRADMLRDLFVRETGEIISRQKFADELEVYMADESVPIHRKHKKEIGALYLPRPVSIRANNSRAA